MLAMWPALVVMILVEGGIVFMVLRWRRRSNDEMPKQTHGNTPLEIGWTIIPTIIIIVFVGVPMIPVLFELGRDPKADAYPVTVTGVPMGVAVRIILRYEGPDGQPVSELGELHIPAGREIAVTLTSERRESQLWRAEARGDAGRRARASTNVMWLKADHPGSFSGQCRELCGIGHADMKLTVIAQSEEDFDAWSREMAARARRAVPDSTSEDTVAAESGE